MKNYWLIGLICIGLFSFCGSSSLAQGPEMVLNEQVFDFEEVEEGEIIEHTFQLLNRGDEVLNIIGVKPG